MFRLASLTGACCLQLLLGCAASTPPPECPATTVVMPDGTTASNRDLNKLDQEQLAAKLIEVTMGKNLAQQILDSMTESLRKMPGLPPGFIDRFRDNAHMADLQTLLIPIYVKMYERETMIAAITFYESEQGRILVSKLPEATRLGMEAGKLWGKRIADQTLTEMGITQPTTK
jgi:hypothetical protein